MKTISFNRAKEAGLLYEQLPGGFKANQLDTKHPNESVQTMVEWLSNRAAATLGLSRIFATGNPEDSNWRANQLFSWPAIQEFQKTVLEPMLDWAFNQWKKWAERKGQIKAYVLEDFLDYVDWEWRKLDDIDEVRKQTAVEMKLRNMTTTLSEELGTNWREKLAQYYEEVKWCRDNGLVHPRDLMLSGG